MAPTAYFIGRPQGIVYLPIGLGKMVRSISVERAAKMWQTGLVSNCAELGFLFQGNTRFVLLWGSLAHRHLLCTCIANIMSPPLKLNVGSSICVGDWNATLVCLLRCVRGHLPLVAEADWGLRKASFCPNLATKGVCAKPCFPEAPICLERNVIFSISLFSFVRCTGVLTSRFPTAQLTSVC